MKRWCVSDVMTRDVVTVNPDTLYKETADLLVSRRVSAVPVVDEQRRVVGLVSESDLLAKLEYNDRAPKHPLASRRLRANWRKAAEWKPAMAAPAREAGYRKWKKAVQRTLDWVEHDEA